MGRTQQGKLNVIFLIFSLPMFCAACGNTFAQSAPRFDSVAIDALDPDAWNGVLFLAKAFNQPAPFALRIGSRSGDFLDGEKIFDAVREVGAHAPDASYCRVAWRHFPLRPWLPSSGLALMRPRWSAA
jgi:hypothetical protein